MYVFTKKSLVITVAVIVVAISSVMLGHLILNFASDHVAESSAEPDKLPVVNKPKLQ